MQLLALERTGEAQQEWALILGVPSDVLLALHDQAPAVHITSTAVHVSATGGDASCVFHFPEECGPVADPATVKCKFRKRRGHLVLSWPVASVPVGVTAEGGVPQAAGNADGRLRWPEEADLLAQLNDSLRRLFRAPSCASWQQAVRLWDSAVQLQAPFAAGFELEGAGCGWLHIPSQWQDRDDLPETDSGPCASEVAADAEFESWTSMQQGRPPLPSLWLSTPGLPRKGADEVLGVDPTLVGSQCHEVDARSLDTACISQLRQYLGPASQQPVILRGLADAVFPAGKAWNFRYLDRSIGNMSVGSVRRSDGDGTLFHYADEHLAEKCAEIGSPWADDSVKHLRDEMTFREFLRCARAAGPRGCDRYFWATLFEYSAESGSLVGSELASLLESDVSRIQWPRLDELADAGGFGSACCAQLFCSGEKSVSAFHYDMVQNVFLHLRGAKRFVLLPPLLGAQALAPFPVGHPRDRSARVRLGDPACGAWPHAALARGAAVEAALGPGDGLFLPFGWWHHVESLEQENISVNFWFHGGAASARPRGAAPPRPLPGAAQLELLRAAEQFLAMTLGHRHLLLFLEWLLRPKALLTKDVPPPGQELLWLQCSNFVLFSAAHLVPPSRLAGWLRALDVRRFLGL